MIQYSTSGLSKFLPNAGLRAETQGLPALSHSSDPALWIGSGGVVSVGLKQQINFSVLFLKTREEMSYNFIFKLFYLYI